MWESTYISKRLDVRPADLADAAARWHRGLKRSPHSSRMVHVSRGFWLSPDARDPADVYEVRGLVWSWGRPVPVTLEFTGWSKTQSEVGIGSRSPAWPVGSSPYVRRVTTALEGVSQALCSSRGRINARPLVIGGAPPTTRPLSREPLEVVGTGPPTRVLPSIGRERSRRQEDRLQE